MNLDVRETFLHSLYPCVQLLELIFLQSDYPAKSSVHKSMKYVAIGT